MQGQFCRVFLSSPVFLPASGGGREKERTCTRKRKGVSEVMGKGLIEGGESNISPDKRQTVPRA